MILPVNQKKKTFNPACLNKFTRLVKSITSNPAVCKEHPYSLICKRSNLKSYWILQFGPKTIEFIKLSLILSDQCCLVQVSKLPSTDYFKNIEYVFSFLSRIGRSSNNLHKWTEGFLHHFLLFYGMDCGACHHSGVHLGCKLKCQLSLVIIKLWLINVATDGVHRYTVELLLSGHLLNGHPYKAASDQSPNEGFFYCFYLV